jgi:hypothetical protein
MWFSEGFSLMLGSAEVTGTKCHQNYSSLSSLGSKKRKKLLYALTD